MIFKMFSNLWDIKPMIIDFSICRGIFNGNVYVLYLCPQDFFSLQGEHIYSFFPPMSDTYHTHL